MRECADPTCRHSENDHTPRCRGVYEAADDGSLHPCDCFEFRCENPSDDC